MIDVTKYEGHTTSMTASVGINGRPRVSAGRMIIARFARYADAVLFADSPELLAEVVRLRAELAEAVAALRVAAAMADECHDGEWGCPVPDDYLAGPTGFRDVRAVLAKHGGA